MDVLSGKKTYIGLIITLLGTTQVSRYVTSEEIGKIIDLCMQLGGLLYAAYGRWKAKPGMQNSGAKPVMTGTYDAINNKEVKP